MRYDKMKKTEFIKSKNRKKGIFTKSKKKRNKEIFEMEKCLLRFCDNSHIPLKIVGVFILMEKRNLSPPLKINIKSGKSHAPLPYYWCLFWVLDFKNLVLLSKISQFQHFTINITHIVNVYCKQTQIWSYGVSKKAFTD